MITALIFNTQNTEGETFEAIFDLSPEGAETVSGLYVSILQSASELTSDSLLCLKGHEESLKFFGEEQNFDDFETLAKQLERAQAFCKNSVTVSLETKSGRSPKKTIVLCVFKKGLKVMAETLHAIIENHMIKSLHAATFKPVGLEILTDLTNERDEALIPVLKTSKSSSISDMFKKYVKENTSNVVEMTPDLADDDFNPEEEEESEEVSK